MFSICEPVSLTCKVEIIIPFHPIPRGINVPPGYQTFMKDHNCPNAFITDKHIVLLQEFDFLSKNFPYRFPLLFHLYSQFETLANTSMGKEKFLWEPQSLLCSSQSLASHSHLCAPPVVNWAKKANPSEVACLSSTLKHFAHMIFSLLHLPHLLLCLLPLILSNKEGIY